MCTKVLKTLSHTHTHTYVEVGDVFSVQRFGDGQDSCNGIDDKQAGGVLVGSWPSHAIAQCVTLVFI